MAARSRIVIASPHAAERETLAAWLSSEGFEPATASTAPDAIEALRRSFDILISDYDFAFRDGLHAAARGRARNPQNPVVVVGEADAAAQTRAENRGASYLARPVERATLVCIISMALTDERPLRRSPRKAVNRFEASASGTACYLIDVSNEGLRLEIPRQRRSSPPPYFDVRVPMIGTTMLVQRVWIAAQGAGAQADVLRCGAALAENSFRIERAWRSFVDAIPARPSDSLRVQL